MTVVLHIGEEKGLRLFRDIVVRNGVSIRKGHTLLANLVPTGEVPFALTAYSYRVEQLIHEGAPVAIDYLPPVVALPTGVGVFRHTPHPHAALLFEDFMLTDGQAILAARQSVPTNPRIKAPPAGLVFIDIPKFMDQQEKWTRLFQATFAAR
jgi:iron(III) transport system substrate-binding protein